MQWVEMELPGSPLARALKGKRQHHLAEEIRKLGEAPRLHMKRLSQIREAGQEAVRSRSSRVTRTRHAVSISKVLP